MESRQPSGAEVRVRGFFSVVALAFLGLASVTVAMVTLGSTQPDYTPTPVAAAPTATPTLSPLLTDSPEPTDTPSPVMTVPLPHTPPEVYTVYTQAHSPDRIWSLVWRYPQVRATPLAAAVNGDILDEVQTRIDTFQSGPAAVEQIPGKVNSMTGSFYMNMSSPALLSLTLKWVDDTSPAHEATGISTLNYDLASGLRLGLLDMFGDQQAALTIISTEARAQLVKSLGGDYDPTLVEPGTSALPTNFANWALTPTGLKITFDEYQVAAYADGMPAVLIPWAKLHDAMFPTGPVARLAGFPANASAAPGVSWPTPIPSPSPTDTPEDLPSEFESPPAS